MHVPTYIVAAIRKYHGQYRNPSLPLPVISGLYTLLPESHPVENHELCWPKPWPNADKPGVYLIFDADLTLLYIGKAAIIGNRLSTYFVYDTTPNRGCRIVHPNWTTPPVYIATAALSESFEASSMEEYLIRTLKPIVNKIWNQNR